MAKSIFRRGLLVLTVFATVLALPMRVAAQVGATSAPSAGASDAELRVAELRPAELGPDEIPDGPTGRSVDSAAVFGRDAYFRADAAAMPPEPIVAIESSSGEVKPHRFWDRENAVLFSAVGGMAAADFYVTHANLASGGRELNPVTRIFAGSTPALATNFALETTGVMAVSYLFHKTGHHRLERATSLFSLGSSSAAVAYDWSHR
jgi:hypothetical protein